MRLFEAILDANHRAIAGDKEAGLHPADYADELPVVALTCVDPRLNALFPNVLGLPGDQFIWLRNAGNIITAPQSSTMRSLALACAIKGGKEIAVIGHTDCQVAKTTTMQLLDRLKDLGIDRRVLPQNLNEFFGVFGSESHNVIQGCDIVRQSPLIGPKVPVHGLIVDINTGKLEWVVNGYEKLTTLGTAWNEAVQAASKGVDSLKALGDFKIGEMKFPETKIGEALGKAENWLQKKIGDLEVTPPQSAAAEKVIQSVEQAAENVRKVWLGHETPAEGQKHPPKIPMPPPIRPRIRGK